MIKLMKMFINYEFILICKSICRSIQDGEHATPFLWIENGKPFMFYWNTYYYKEEKTNKKLENQIRKFKLLYVPQEPAHDN